LSVAVEGLTVTVTPGGWETDELNKFDVAPPPHPNEASIVVNATADKISSRSFVQVLWLTSRPQ
jgi:hypothetical protein